MERPGPKEVGGKLVEMTMRFKAPSAAQSSFLMPTLREQAFADSYSDEGRPAKPVRLMVGLLLLQQLHNLGDEAVVAQ